MKTKVKSSVFVLGASFVVWALASVSAQVHVPDIPRVPVAPHFPDIQGSTIVHTPPPIETEPPHFHPHHGGHSDLGTPQPTIAPYSPAK